MDSGGLFHSNILTFSVKDGRIMISNVIPKVSSPEHVTLRLEGILGP